MSPVDESIDPLETSTRRGWLSALARNARHQVQEGAEAVGPGGLRGLLAQMDPLSDAATDVVTSDPTDYSASDRESARRPARAPERAMPVEELITLAHEEGLTGHVAALRALARLSVRMTGVPPTGADGWVHATDDWVDVSGSEIVLAQINLAATGDYNVGLPTDGWLVVFAGTDVEPSGGEGFHAHAVVQEHPAERPPGTEPVALGAELALPRVWNDAVQAVGLDVAATEAYARTRAKLPDLQGVERDDDGGSLIAYHRLLGYPDDTTGTMPSECARRWSDPSDWRLLTQVSLGDFRRAYLWIHEADLVAGRFDDLRLFVR